MKAQQARASPECRPTSVSPRGVEEEYERHRAEVFTMQISGCQRPNDSVHKSIARNLWVHLRRIIEAFVTIDSIHILLLRNVHFRNVTGLQGSPLHVSIVGPAHES